MKKRAWLFALSLLLALPAAAQVTTRGYASIELNLHAGPDVGYPVVDLLPTGAALYVHGCTVDWAWCDVSVYDARGWEERGWVAGDYIDYPYQDRWVSVYSYGEVIGIPVINFVIGDYWFHHYRHNHFYHDRDYWYHHRFAYHEVPRYRHERRHLADGFRDRARFDGDRHDRDGDRGYRQDADARYRQRDGMDRRENVSGRHTGLRVERRMDRRAEQKRRLAPTVARQIGPRNERAFAQTPRRNLPPQRTTRYQVRYQPPSPGNRALARSMGGRMHASRPARAPAQHRANRQQVRRGNGNHNRRRHD